MFWVSQETETPMPTFSDDDVVDYMVREAIVTRVAYETKQARKQKKSEESHKDHKQWAKEMGLV